MTKLQLRFAVEEATKYSAAIIAAFESHADACDYCDMIAARHMENGRDNDERYDKAATGRGYVITQTLARSGDSMVTNYSVVPMDF